ERTEEDLVRVRDPVRRGEETTHARREEARVELEGLEAVDLRVREAAAVPVLDQGLVGNLEIVVPIESRELDAERSPAVPGREVECHSGRSGIEARIPDVLEGTTDRVALRPVQLVEGDRIGDPLGKLAKVASEAEVVEGTTAIGAEILKRRLRIEARRQSRAER